MAEIGELSAKSGITPVMTVVVASGRTVLILVTKLVTILYKL